MAKIRNKLTIKCHDHDCENDEHCFTPKKLPNKPRELPTKCKSCGKSPVEWHLLHARQPENMGYLVDSLKTEHIRAFFWRYDISWVSKNILVSIGHKATETRVRRCVISSIGSAKHFYEGRQTPLVEDDDPIHYAQHATGTCCRKCFFYWHGIREGKDLTGAETQYAEQLIWRYLDEKVPELNSVM